MTSDLENKIMTAYAANPKAVIQLFIEAINGLDDTDEYKKQLLASLAKLESIT